MGIVYLDHNATTRPTPEVVAAVREGLETLWANPSSVHRLGQQVRQRVELARASVARLIGAKPGEIVFTSGGTESDNLAIFGTVERRPDRPVVITTPIEHSAVREPTERLESMGKVVVRLPVDSDGVVDPDEFARVVAEHAERLALVTIQWANNETGALQAVPELASICRRTARGVVFHTDATQAVGKLPVHVAELDVDLMTFSAHKFHGPKGIGALYVRRGLRLASQNVGGPQERERRGGTENVPGILGMGAAAELVSRWFEEGDPGARRVERLRDEFEARILAEIPGTAVNSGSARFGRLWNTSNVGFDRLEAEAILLSLSERGICASAGAACSSGSLDPSPILRAMGVPDTLAHGSVRFSMSRETTQEEVDSTVEALKTVISRLRKALPVADDEGVRSSGLA